MNVIEFCIMLIFFYLCVLMTAKERYIYSLPTYPIYPDSKEESKRVLEIMKKRSVDDEHFFRKTDPSVIHAFSEYIDEPMEELRNIITSIPILFTVYTTKYGINRPRPYQVNPLIIPMKSTTDKTPSYPAGHAFQAYFLADVLGKRYPAKKMYFNKLAERCDLVRVQAGLHYPSDGQFAKRILYRLLKITG
jgi:hypothetical protein